MGCFIDYQETSILRKNIPYTTFNLTGVYIIKGKVILVITISTNTDKKNMRFSFANLFLIFWEYSLKVKVLPDVVFKFFSWLIDQLWNFCSLCEDILL